MLPEYSGLRRLLRRDPSALISDLIEKRYGRRSAEVQQTITATGVAAAIAGELQVEPRAYFDHIKALKTRLYEID